MWATILEIINNFLKSIPIFKSYFPPKSTEQGVEEGGAAIDKKIGDEQSTGRPQ